MADNRPDAIITVLEDGRKVVDILTVRFSGKRKIDWDGVEQYLKKYIGKSYVIDETDDLIYIGIDFPDEYTSSKDSAKAYGTIGKAKANASQAVGELIQTATNVRFVDNKDSKHSINAKNGWYWCTVQFTLPITDENKNVIGKNLFTGRMVIRCDGKGKKYLYDIVDIKKRRSTPLEQNAVR